MPGRVLVFHIVLTFFGLCSVSKAQQPITGIVNTYTPVLVIDSCRSSLAVSSTAGFSVGDKVLIIQMKGATIDTSNTSSFGTILSYNDAGNFEFSYVAAISGNTISLPAPLMRTYTVSGKVQLIRVPVYNVAKVTGTLTCKPWDGSTGGVLAVEADSLKFDFQAKIDVSGKGFRGGLPSVNAPGPPISCDMSPHSPFFTGAAGQKGEGIAEWPAGREAGRTALANGGGGGNSQNAGGGGGANMNPGGTGGNAVSSPSAVCTAGGIGGHALLSQPWNNKIFMGGGGGGGHQDNNAGSPGGNGGGIVYMKVGRLFSGNIYSNGRDAAPAGNDGAGGGGAAGTVVLDANYISTFSIQVNGGMGGNNTWFNTPADPQCSAPGGGGSGGVVWGKYGSFTLVINHIGAGNHGLVMNPASPCDSTSLGADEGGPGSIYSFIKLDAYTPFSGSSVTYSVCEGDSVQVQAPSEGDSYSWSPYNGLSSASIVDPVASPQNTATYYVAVTSQCYTSIDTVTVNVVPITPVVTNPDVNIEVGDSVQLSATGGNGNYDWYGPEGLICSNCSTLVVTPSVTTTYYVTSDQQGCAEGDSVTIFVAASCLGDINTPNVFTPNGDGVNDVLKVENGCVSILTIYNRWGDKVNEVHGSFLSWDGTDQNGSPAPEGTYYYVLYNERQPATLRSMRGFISLLR